MPGSCVPGSVLGTPHAPPLSAADERAREIWLSSQGGRVVGGGVGLRLPLQTTRPHHLEKHFPLVKALGGCQALGKICSYLRTFI